MTSTQNQVTDRANWAGTYSYAAASIVEPETIEELQELVAASPRIRALGTRHSFNDIADTPGVLVNLSRISPDIIVDGDTVTVGSAVRYGVLATELEKHGRALHNMGSLPHISVMGASSTGTHGSGDGNKNLSSAVVGVEIVRSDGSIEAITDPEVLDASVIALGALGIVTRVTLRTQPTFDVRQDVYRGISFDDILEHLDELTGLAYSVSIFTDWGGSPAQVWLKSRMDADPQIPDAIYGALRSDLELVGPVGDDTTNLTEQGGSVGPWLERLPHFRLDSVPSNGDEIQTEYFVSRPNAAPALAAVRTLAADIQPHLIITELRTIAADDRWLSPAYHQDSLAIHFTWKNHPDEVHAMLPRIEELLKPFDPRPHWGKVNSLGRDDIAPRYERLADFLALAERVDPTGKFRNAYLERLLWGE